MRTDSTTLSDEALTAARTQARALYGDDYVPDAPRRYERKVKNAQEAHEAIRPAGETFRTPDEAAASCGDELRLYDLVWKRTVASQMIDATGTSAQVRLGPTVPEVVAPGHEAEFSASGRVITFPGFLRAYVEGADDPEAELADREVRAAAAGRGRRRSTGARSSRAPHHPAAGPLHRGVAGEGHGGAGRRAGPRTYASVIETILDRGYVWKKGTALVPSFTAFAVVGLLERYFGDLVDYGFTAAMEDDLDEIAGGREEALPWLTRFYFGSAVPGAGNGHGGGEEVEALGLKTTVAAHLGEIDAREINSIPDRDGADGQDIVVRVGRYGPYLQRGDDRASIPDDLAPDELTVDRAVELLEAPTDDRELGVDPETGLDGLVKAGRFGPYVQLGEVVDGGEKPRTASLFATMTPATVTLEEAARAPSLPADGRGRPDEGRGDRRPQRPVRPLPQAGQRHPEPDERGAALHHRPRRGAGPVRPAQATPGPDGRRAAAGARRPTRTPGCPWWCGTAASVPTSPTARPTPLCARATTSRRSRSSGRPSCWPSVGPPGPSKREEGGQEDGAAKKKAAAKKAGHGQEGGAPRRPPRQEGRRRQDGERSPRRPRPER